MKKAGLFCIRLILMIVLPSVLFAQPEKKLRILVTTDIEADPDDSQSLIRFLTYSNQWDVEGLIATTSIHQKKRVSPETIISILEAYQKVQPNLLKHEKGYPSFAELRPKVKRACPSMGWKGLDRVTTPKARNG